VSNIAGNISAEDKQLYANVFSSFLNTIATAVFGSDVSHSTGTN
jgi:hypothetical protein